MTFIWTRIGTTLRRLPAAIRAILVLSLLSAGCDNSPQGNEDAGMWFFVLVKSSNYEQDRAGELTFLNYHFFSEVFPKDDNGDPITGRLTRHDAPDTPIQGTALGNR